MNTERKVHGPHILLKTVLETLFDSQIEGEKLIWNFEKIKPISSESAFVYLLFKHIKKGREVFKIGDKDGDKDWRILQSISIINSRIKNRFFQGKQFYELIEKYQRLKNSCSSRIKNTNESEITIWFQTFKKFNLDFILLDYFFLVTKYDSFYFNRNEIKDALIKMKETDLIEEWEFLCSLKDTKFF